MSTESDRGHFRSALVAPALLLLCLGPTRSHAQSTFATITGSVTDPAGAPIPGVAIEAIQTETNYRYAVLTNDAGQYTIGNIREGLYRLTAKANGFQDLVMDNIVLAARDLRRADMHMQLSAI